MLKSSFAPGPNLQERKSQALRGSFHFMALNCAKKFWARTFCTCICAGVRRAPARHGEAQILCPPLLWELGGEGSLLPAEPSPTGLPCRAPWLVHWVLAGQWHGAAWPPWNISSALYCSFQHFTNHHKEDDKKEGEKTFSK